MSSGLAVNLDLGEERASLETALCRVWGSVLADRVSWQLGLADGLPLLAMRWESQQCESGASRPPGHLGTGPPTSIPTALMALPWHFSPLPPGHLEPAGTWGAGPSPVSLGAPLKLCGVIPPCAWAPSHGSAFTRSFPLSLLLSLCTATGSSSLCWKSHQHRAAQHNGTGPCPWRTWSWWPGGDLRVLFSGGLSCCFPAPLPCSNQAFERHHHLLR